jgi:hypothetical protein
MLRSVRIAPAEVPVDFFATFRAALTDTFGAAAFVDLLAVLPAIPVALADTDFDAASLRAGSFLADVLVAAFAIGEILLMREQLSSRLMDKGIAVQD